MNIQIETHKNKKAKNKNSIFFQKVPVIQKKLAIGASDDAYEVEADRIADKVVHMSDTQVQTRALINLPKIEIDNIQKQENEELEGPCIKSFFGGEVYFDNLSARELNRIAVINEDDDSGLDQAIVNNRWYNCDGLWLRGRGEWFKIPGHCKVEVRSISGNNLNYYKCCNWAASIVVEPPRWVNHDLDKTKSNPF